MPEKGKGKAQVVTRIPLCMHEKSKKKTTLRFPSHQAPRQERLRPVAVHALRVTLTAHHTVSRQVTLSVIGDR